MLNLNAIKHFAYVLRSLIWSYPDTLLFSDNSLLFNFSSYYKRLRPFSHFFSTILLIFIFSGFVIFNNQMIYLIDQDTYIEGVIVGVDEQGKLRNISRVNPLVPSSIQLEKDLANLIYEGLIEVRPDGEIDKVLIDSFESIKKNNHYRFKLKNNIYWHDGTLLTTKDVEATFYLLRRLDADADTSSKYSNVLSNQFDEIIILDDLNFELKLKSENAVLPTFWESVNFKILPERYISNLNSFNILNVNQGVNLKPIGTGPFGNLVVSSSQIKLTRNQIFHKDIPHFKEVIFKLFQDEPQALSSLKSLQIHAITGLSTEGLNQAQSLEAYFIKNTNTVYNQYWALFFELSKNSDKPYQNPNVRQAINYAVDREKLTKKIANQAVVATGPIPENSFAYNDLMDEIKFDPEYAKKLLEQEGWILDTESGIRTKDDEKLEIKMVFVDNIDRNILASSIKEDLMDVGIDLILIPESIRTVNDRYILTRDFEMLLYGQTTFIDPDRYELFHSSQIGFPGMGGLRGSTGLNLSGYTSSKESVEIEDQELLRVPKVDTLLENGRSYIDQTKRKEIYEEFQLLLKEEVPVVVLYHPVYTYVMNQRVKPQNLDQMNSLEGRFLNINEWTIL